MGRPSKLTDKQWDAIAKRLLAGEKAADLAREFGVSKTAISTRVSKRIETVKSVANQIVSAEESLRSLPVSEQLHALTLVDELRAISMHLAGAGKYGAATSHRLAGIAHAKAQEIDDAKPFDEESREAVRDVAGLMKTANDSSYIGISLLAANKEMAKELNKASRPQPKSVSVTVLDASRPADADPQ